MTLLSVQGLRVELGGQRVVDGVDFAIDEGQVLCLLGPSGCGKTTTLRAVAGLQRSEGTVRFAGRDLAGLPPEQRALGLVFQDGAVFPHLSVRRNIAFGLDDRSGRSPRVVELLHLLQLDGLADRRPHELSGGQLQRVALGRALARSPRLVLLDEPFASLDAALKVSLRRELFSVLRSTGTAALLVTHDQDEAVDVADQVAVMLAGRLVQNDRPDTVLREPADAFVASFVGEAALVPVAVQGGVAQLGSTTLPCAGPGLDQPACVAVIRPDDLEITDRGPLRGVVERSEFLGGVRVLHVVLDSGALVRVVHRAPITGEVSLAPRVETLWVVPAPESPDPE